MEGMNARRDMKPSHRIPWSMDFAPQKLDLCTNPGESAAEPLQAAGVYVRAAELGRVTFSRRLRLLRVTRIHAKSRKQSSQIISFLPLQLAPFFDRFWWQCHTPRGRDFYQSLQCSFSASTEAHEPHVHMNPCTPPAHHTVCCNWGEADRPRCSANLRGLRSLELGHHQGSKYIWTFCGFKKVSRKFQE